jgi:hypothetical protein
MSSQTVTAVVGAGQNAIKAIEGGASLSFANLVITMSAIGAHLLGDSAENFGTFVTKYAEDVQANPTQLGIYRSALQTRWAEFVAAEKTEVEQDLSSAVGAVADLFDGVANAVATAGKTLATILGAL